MCDANVVSLVRADESTISGNQRLLAELDELSLYRLVRRARRQGITIRQPSRGNVAGATAISTPKRQTES